MKLSRLHPRHFWSSESGLTGLLIFFLVYLIVMYSLAQFRFGKFLTHLLFTLVVLAGILTTFTQQWLRFFALTLAIATLTLTWMAEIWSGRNLAALNSSLSLIYLLFLLAVVVVQVFREGPITGHRIRGAIVVYLLLGVIWALSYQLLALLIPGAFLLPSTVSVDDPESLGRGLVYFSFITLTTLGYGDIIPVHPLARLLAMFEALVGQLYPAITLARLVSLEIMHRHKE